MYTNHMVSDIDVKSVDSVNNPNSNVSTEFDTNPINHEVLQLKSLPSHEVRPVSKRDDSELTHTSTRPSLSDANIAPDYGRRDSSLASRSSKGQLWWVRTCTRSKRRIDTWARKPGISHVLKWINGPLPPRVYRIKPILPKVQSFPTSLLERIFPTSAGCAIVTLLVWVLWLVAFSVILATSKKTTIGASGDDAPVRLSCVGRLWGDATSCGLDGKSCQPFRGSSFPFICPSNCASVKVLNPYTIGDQQINYRNLVVGGPTANNQSLSIYRGDSFICAAAVHAGIVSNTYGGCGVLNREGTQNKFPSTDQNGIQSVAFQPSFPLSFSLLPGTGNCRDPQWNALIASVCATMIISMIATPSMLLFSSIFSITFFQIALASDAPYSLDFAGVVSIAFERFLPAVFVAIALYRYCIRRTMRNLTAYWERTLLWVGGCWVGALNSYTFDRIPLSRLTGHDIRKQPGAIVALVIIVIVILAAAVYAVWTFRKEGRLPYLIRFYVPIGILMGCLAAIPGLNFRLHHYILGLLLLPGTSIQTRSSLLYQGLLLGLFINGVARWGFSSILQTSAVLYKGAELGSDLPEILTPRIVADTISFTISQIAEGFDGLSVVVNDVEKYQATNMTLPVVFNWTRTAIDEMAFFRFAFTGTYTLGGIWYGDYSKAGTWYGNGTWKDIPPTTST